MSERPYETGTISELEAENGWSPIRGCLGVQAFGINAWTAKEADAQLIGEHEETASGHEELYLLLSGRATFTVEGKEIDASPGTIVFVSNPGATRAAVAREPGTTVLAVGGKPGEAYRPRAWETNASVFPMFERGEHQEAKRVLTEALDRYDERSGLLYNLACAEAQLGETETALEHLRAAVGERPSFVDFAREDSDLEPLRADPRFEEILAAA